MELINLIQMARDIDSATNSELTDYVNALLAHAENPKARASFVAVCIELAALIQKTRAAQKMEVLS